MFWLHFFGLAECPARGSVTWGRKANDYDAVLCIAFFFLPLIPIRAIHISIGTMGRRSGDDASRTLKWPIRMTFGLVARAILRRWLYGFFFLSIIFLLASLDMNNRGRPALSVFSGVCFGVSQFGLWLLKYLDRRNTAIRYVLGRHEYGSSDPVSWKSRHFEYPPDAFVLYGTQTFADAVPILLKQRELSRAMWAARLSTALEDEEEGETLTDEVLSAPGVFDAVVRVQENPRAWREEMVEAHSEQPPRRPRRR
jgi:hypothetical protein